MASHLQAHLEAATLRDRLVADDAPNTFKQLDVPTSNRLPAAESPPTAVRQVPEFLPAADDHVDVVIAIAPPSRDLHRLFVVVRRGTEMPSLPRPVDAAV